MARGGQQAATQGNDAEQQNAAAGQPDATLPPRWGQNSSDAAHGQHGGESPQSERRHDEKTGKSAAGTRRLRGEGIDQRAGQEAVEHAESERSRTALRL